MRTRELIQLLERFDPEAEVRLCFSPPGRVVAAYRNVWVGDYGGGAQINAAPDVGQFYVYVGLGMDQVVSPPPLQRVPAPIAREPGRPTLDLGRYEDDDLAAKVHDFYVFHQRLNEPLRFPQFDYEHWIPPRTSDGQYNEHIARILRDRLMRD